MIDKDKLEIRIREYYEQLVFEGYSVKELAFMGTCLIRMAIERQPATTVNLIPHLEG
jgi:hypothetical protein